MVIRLDENYNAMTSTALLGYVGETNARPVSVEGMEIDGADRYVMTIDYGDGVQYEVDITGGQWTPTADILRSAQTVSCQIAAKKLSGDEYILVKKSRIFRLRIGTAIGDTAIPSPDVAMDALDRIDAIGRQAHADMQTAVTAAETATTMANNAAKSATAAEKSADTATQAAERAETAAQTAQAVADSLPEDYTTAVGKIAENTSEIASVKLSDKELKRRVNALYDIGQGITHKFETDSSTAYAKIIPTGAKLMSVKSVGGRSIVFNQMIPDSIIHVTVTIDEDVTEDKWISRIETDTSNIISAHGHKVLGKCVKDASNPTANVVVRFGDNNANISNGYESEHSTEKGIYTLQSSVKNGALYYRAFAGATAGTYGFTLQLYDLTAMFGVENEPTIVEEFEAMFPNGYYPYNEGELMSMSVNNVVEQGKNLFDCYGFSCIAILNVNGERKLNNSYGTTISTIEPTNKIVVTQSQAPESVIAHSNNGWFCVGIKGMEQSKRYTFSFDFTTTKMLIQNPVLQILVNGRFPKDAINISELNVKKRVSFTFEYTKVDDRQYIELRLSGMSGIFENFQLDEGSTATAYTPYYTPISYTIPQAIQNLDGYGWSAGTARNYVDYENKRYVQCVGSVDLGTLTWMKTSSQSVGDYFYAPVSAIGFKRLGAFGITVHNILCSKYITVARNPNAFVDKTIVLDGDNIAVSQIQVKDTAYTDATAFKQAMSGVMLYYELAAPIVTDISSLIPDDFLRNMEVEAGGSVTFKNSNGDDYRIPVPSEEEYVVKLSEVGGTT